MVWRGGNCRYSASGWEKRFFGRNDPSTATQGSQCSQWLCDYCLCFPSFYWEGRIRDQTQRTLLRSGYRRHEQSARSRTHGASIGAKYAFPWRFANGDRHVLSQTLHHVRLRRGYGCGGALQCHCRRFTRCQLCRTTRNLFECLWHKRSGRCLPSLLCLPIHRSRHFLPHDQWLRSLWHCPVGRRAEDGAIGHGSLWGHVFHWHRNRLQKRSLDHRRLWLRWKCRAGCCQSRWVFCLQTHAQTRLSSHPRKTPRHERDQDDLRSWRRQADQKCTSANVRAHQICHQWWWDSQTRRMGLHHWRSLFGSTRQTVADGYRMGEGW